MKAKALPPVELLREWFSYDPHTGGIYWKEGRKNNHTHEEAGYLTPRRRRIISVTIEGKPYNLQASRVAYYLYHGVDPLGREVDHINRQPDDNRIVNLRAVTKEVNMLNRNISNTQTRVRIRYPDGRGVIVVDSIKTAAQILNRTPVGVTYTMNHTGQVYWGWGGARQKSGIFVERA
jgi:hypothetical protein